ncbi:flagellar hook-length control protein FliK [Massilia sp. PAMC28688]|uniref:flagellar hook-length control protein FliK n=1 Tax=Massilia sp. PAMC28688 TaxID=2861283 RepID=UPI001C63466C|nr:flagellar hook-length control protein FliK [Massilia sp. PAMC28688]QYF92035.1 flagellar hook-length control protein FliK [Massilia sp. PAMC28688]
MQLRSDFNAASTVRPVGKVDATARTDGVADARQEAFQRSMTPLLGKSMTGAVLARLADGQFVVKVAGNPVRMMLPPGSQVGTEVPLTLISTNPRPTFQITAGDGEALPATIYLPPGAQGDGADTPPGQMLAGRAAAGLAQAAAMQAAASLTEGQALAEGGPGTQGPAISAAGRIISSVLAAAQQASDKSGAVQGTEPLMAKGTPDPAQLASRLQQTVAQSGLFYESHLAEWAEGTRTMGELLREPQTTRAPTAPTDPATAQFINLQLTSQEQSRVLWQGQLVPGQDMRWEIEKDAPEQRGGQDEEEAATWRSGMRFRLPLLGEIEATVVMAGGQCQIEIQTGSSDIGSLLKAHAARLTSAMEAAGTPLSSLSIGMARSGADDD